MNTLSLVVPIYDSPDLARRLAGRLDALRASAAACGFELKETLFVDDGSPAPLPPFPGVTSIRNETNMGKGYSVRRGVLMAKGDWVLMSDADESVPLPEFARLAAHIPEASVICGSRKGCDERPFHRRVLSWVFRLFARVPGVQDTQCGFKLFDRLAVRTVFAHLRTAGFAFDVELLRRARKAGLAVAEVPVEWHGGRRSTLRVLRDAPRMLIDLFRILRCG